MVEGQPSQRRSVGTWAVLLAVWCAGLISWAAYFLALVWLLGGGDGR